MSTKRSASASKKASKRPVPTLENLKEKYQEIDRLSRVYDVLSRANDEIVKTNDTQTLFDAVCKIAVEAGLMKMAWIGLADMKTQKVNVVSHFGFEDGYLDHLSISVNGQVEEGRGPTGIAVRERQHFICNDIENDPRMTPWREQALKRGYRSSAAFPLVVDGRGVGAISIYSGEPGFFESEEADLFDKLAAEISFALRMLQLEKHQWKTELRLQASEERYRTLFRNMLEGFAYCEMIYDEEGHPVDWIYLDVNDSFGRLTGLQNVIGKKVSELIPRLKEANPELFDIYGDVAKTGAPNEFESWVAPVNRWLHLSVISPQKNHFVAVFEDITKRKIADEELLRSHRSLKESFRGLIQALALTIEARDPYTASHQHRVAELAAAIAVEQGMPDEETAGLEMAGMVHDIGKIYVPAEILNKPGGLSEIEFEIIKTHATAGYDILKDVKFDHPVAEMVYQHHERLDGSGYPRGLKAKDILVGARIMAVADVVEAMSSHRPYRAALGVDAALDEIVKYKGTLYEAAAVDTCVKLFREKGYSFST